VHPKYHYQIHLWPNNPLTDLSFLLLLLPHYKLKDSEFHYHHYHHPVLRKEEADEVGPRVKKGERGNYTFLR
jgi:hypothetical protein